METSKLEGPRTLYFLNQFDSANNHKVQHFPLVKLQMHLNWLADSLSVYKEISPNVVIVAYSPIAGHRIALLAILNLRRVVEYEFFSK